MLKSRWRITNSETGTGFRNGFGSAFGFVFVFVFGFGFTIYTKKGTRMFEIKKPASERLKTQQTKPPSGVLVEDQP